MPKSVPVSNAILALVFNATAWADIAENDSSSPATNLYVSLHTADPGTGGNQTTNETSYTNYARQAVSRNTGGWTAPSGGSTSNAAIIQFPQCGVTGATITHVAVGTASSGAGSVLYAAALSSSLAVALGIQPQFAIGALTAAES